MTPDYIKSLVRKVLREEGLLPSPVIVQGPDCEPRVLEDEGDRPASYPPRYAAPMRIRDCWVAPCQGFVA